MNRMLAAFAAAVLLLSGCAGPGSIGEVDVAITDSWVKTAEAGEMSAAFGIIENHGADDLTVVAASSPVSGVTELHEVVDDGTGAMVMREIEGGFLVPAGGRLVLEPGGNHIMLMGLTEDILAGTEVTVLIEFSNGETMTIQAPARDYAGANEEYEHDHEHGHDH